MIVEKIPKSLRSQMPQDLLGDDGCCGLYGVVQPRQCRNMQVCISIQGSRKVVALYLVLIFCFLPVGFIGCFSCVCLFRKGLSEGDRSASSYICVVKYADQTTLNDVILVLYDWICGSLSLWKLSFAVVTPNFNFSRDNPILAYRASFRASREILHCATTS